MSTFQEIIDKENIRALVARDVTCQQTGRVLNLRNCLVVRDGDGDPIIVLDPAAITENPQLRDRVEEAGWSLDHRRK